MKLKIFTLSFLLLAPLAAFADGTDEQALKDLEQYLNSPSERSKDARGKKDATETLNLLEAFPAYAQDELNKIVMMIMREKKSGAKIHVDTYKTQGAEATLKSFSPDVKARVEALMKRLSSDPKFNSRNNLEQMRQLIPAFLSGGSVS